MLLDKKMHDALNHQINEELYSAYLYLSMSAQFEAEGLKGFAKWFSIQAKEEVNHAMKFYHFIINRGETIHLQAIAEPTAKWDSPLKAFQASFKHEQKITGLIHSLVNLAIKLNDHATSQFLQWFVSEQVEEEANANEMVHKLQQVKDDISGLFFLDKLLGKRETNDE
jgi:ferritin